MVKLTNWPPEQVTKLAKYSQDSDFRTSSFDSSFCLFLKLGVYSFVLVPGHIC